MIIKTIRFLKIPLLEKIYSFSSSEKIVNIQNYIIMNLFQSYMPCWKNAFTAFFTFLRQMGHCFCLVFIIVLLHFSQNGKCPQSMKIYIRSGVSEQMQHTTSPWLSFDASFLLGLSGLNIWLAIRWKYSIWKIKGLM